MAAPTAPAEPVTPEPAPPERPAATNIIEALRHVMTDLPGIGKTDRASDQQGGYAYRGIEAITRHAQGLFGKHGVVAVPHVESMEQKEITVGNKPWSDTYLEITYRLYGPGGTGDYIDVGPLYAIGRDGTDKGSNKAMTQAFKQMLLQVLCIGDGKDDPDTAGGTHEADQRGAPAPLSGDIASMRPPDVVAALKDRGLSPAGSIDQLRQRLSEAVAAEKPSEAPQTPAEAPPAEPPTPAAAAEQEPTDGLLEAKLAIIDRVDRMAATDRIVELQRRLDAMSDGQSTGQVPAKAGDQKNMLVDMLIEEELADQQDAPPEA